MRNFWQKLPKPFTVLAPMDGVTDVVFRQIIACVGKPDVMFTEFINVEALNSKGFEKAAQRLKFTSIQKPIIAQLWGKQANNFYQAAKLVKNLGFNGIDLNMGCPDKSVVKNGCCSALIGNYAQVMAIVKATQEGGAGLPVSVKTRLGIDEIQTEEWIGFLLRLNLAAITIHGRTVKELSDVSAHWDEIGKAVQLKNQLNPETVIIGNGDVSDYSEILQKHRKYQVDGVMVGRGVFKNIKIFYKVPSPLTFASRINLLCQHARLFEKTWQGTKSFQIMKKYFKIYLSDFDGAGQIRTNFLECQSFIELKQQILVYGKAQTAVKFTNLGFNIHPSGGVFDAPAFFTISKGDIQSSSE